jgi:hypothetical protein
VGLNLIYHYFHVGSNRFNRVHKLYVFIGSHLYFTNWIKLYYYALKYSRVECFALPKELGSHGSAVNNTVRQLAGAIGTAVVIKVYTVQATSHASELSMENETITTIQLEALASIFGSSDAYVFMLILSFVALIVTCFMPKKTTIQTSQS